LLEDFNPEDDKITIEANKDLIFLGFIILRNRLKDDTSFYMSKIIESNVDLIISTGDNVFTSISVARECYIIDKESQLRMIDLKFLDDKKFMLKM